jgi:hypothetical protein
MGVLETILQDTKTLVNTMKNTNTLDVTKLVKVTIEIATKLYSLNHFSDKEHDALLKFFMKESLELVGAGFSDEALTAALAAAKNLRNLLAPVRKFLTCIPCIAASSSVLDSNDSALLKKAVESVESTQGSVSPSLEVRQVEAQKDTPPQNTPDAEPTPLTS